MPKKLCNFTKVPSPSHAAHGPLPLPKERKNSLRRSPIILILLSTLGVLILASLGIWQIARLQWKTALIEQVNQRVQAPAIAAPEPSQWPSVNAKGDAYLHVYARGTFLHDHETLVRAATEHGAGYWVMTPLQTDAGYILFINRGFVPPENRDAMTRAAGQIKGPVTVTGLLRMTEPKGAFLRRNNPADGRWYSRDVNAMASAQGLRNFAPYFIDADSTPNPGGLPVGGLTVINFQNNHLVYAITWFTLALLLAVTTIMFINEKNRL